jgi:hypothetical protein
LPAFGRRVQKRIAIAGRPAVSERNRTLVPIFASSTSVVVSSVTVNMLRERRVGSRT